MAKDIVVNIIGLDTSHSIEYPRRMQAPDCAPELKVPGLRAGRCLRFETPFQNKEGLDKRQKQLEDWGIKVTDRFEEAVKDCDALMLEINDPAYHLEYFQKCAGLGKPIYLDKPMADTTAHGREIARIAREKKVPFLSASSLRFVPQLLAACAVIPQPSMASVYGALGTAPAGSSVVWYGVHAAEMLERALGRGAVAVQTKKDALGVTVIVRYPDGRRGIVELNEGSWIYGGCLRTKDKAAPFVVDMSRAYTDELIEVLRFFRGETPSLAIEDTLEVMGILDAAERSLGSGREETL